jgi:hypothetical protein
MDMYPDRVTFMTFDPKEENVLPRCRHLLNTVYAQARADPVKVCGGTDCSIPKCTSYQATALFVIKQAGNETLASTWVAGRVLSADAKLFAICMAVYKAVMLENCHHIIIFRLHGYSQPSNRPVLRQTHSLAICKALTQWFALSEDHRIEFITTPSKMEWGL